MDAPPKKREKSTVSCRLGEVSASSIDNGIDQICSVFLVHSKYCRFRKEIRFCFLLLKVCVWRFVLCLLAEIERLQSPSSNTLGAPPITAPRIVIFLVLLMEINRCAESRSTVYVDRARLFSPGVRLAYLPPTLALDHRRRTVFPDARRYVS